MPTSTESAMKITPIDPPRPEGDDPEELVQLGSRVLLPRRLRDEFKRRFPVYGSASFIFQTALEELMALTDDDPTLTERIRSAMRGAIERRIR